MNQLNPVVDLQVSAGTHMPKASVKSGWSPNRHVWSGAPHSLAQLPDTDLMVIVRSARKGVALSLAPDSSVFWTIPGQIARDKALAAHHHDARHAPGSATPSVLVKHKANRSPHTRSGAPIQSWQTRLQDAGHLLPLAEDP